MNKIKTFFNTLVKSCFQPTYFQDVIKANFSFSVKYFLVFNLLIALIVGARSLTPIYNFNLPYAVKSALELYPQELAITVDQTGLTINQPTPYQVKLEPKVMARIFGGTPNEYSWGGSEINLVTFESDENFAGVQNFEQYNSLAVVTNSGIYVVDDMDTGEIRAVPFEFEEMKETWVLDRQTLDLLVDELLKQPFIKDKLYLYVIAGAVILLLYPGMLIWRTWTIMFYSVLIWALSSMMMQDKRLSYTKVAQLSIHALTPVILLAMLLNVFFTYSLHGWLYFTAYLVWMLVGLSQVQAPATKSNKKKT